MAIVTGHRATIIAAMADQDWGIQCSAVTAWLRSDTVDTAELVRFMTDAPAQTRQHVYRLLRRRPSINLADAMIDPIRERFGDQEAGRLLPVCSPETVARLLPELCHVGNWSLLGVRHPAAVLDDAARQLADLTVPGRGIWWTRFGPGVWAAISALPHRVLHLLERYAPPTSLPGALRHYSQLARVDARRVLALLTAPGRAGWLARTRLPRQLLRHLSTTDTADLAVLARSLRDSEPALVSLLKAVPPGRRCEVYDAAWEGVDRSLSQPSDQILALLPRARRFAEVRRVLDLGQIRDDEARTLHYTAFLPWEEVRDALVAATRRAQAEERAAGYELVLACAARSGDPAALTEAIGFLLKLRNEQDPVRGPALAALANAAPTLLQPATAETLHTITTDALQARDTGGQTRQALSTLAITVLRHHFDRAPLLSWALDTLQKLFGDRIPALGRLDTRLRVGQEVEVFTAVQGWLESGISRGEFDALFAVTRALGRRARRLPVLQDMLRRAIDARNVSNVLCQAIALWLDDPATRSTRVEHVLFTDVSTVTLGEVWNVISSRRTDLLDLVLTGSPPQGKFLAKGVQWVPLHAPGVRRWLPRQQQQYATLVGRLAADAGTPIFRRTAAITAAAGIPDFGDAIVHRYLDSSNVNLAEAALGALVWTDHPADAVPILLAHTGDDRARVAVYATARAARFVPPSRLGEILTDERLASGKITSRKEILRLAARMSVPDAGHLLYAAWRQEGQHRDVRAAIVSAARQRLHDPVSWKILSEAAAGSREEALAVLSDADPLTVATRHRPRYGQLLARSCRSDDQRVANAAWLALPHWAQWTPDVPASVVTRLTDFDDRTVWRGMAAVLVALLDAGLAGASLRDVVDHLARLDSADTDGADHGRDRPARQRLTIVVDQVAAWSRNADADIDRTGLAQAGRQLARQPDFIPQAATLLLHAIAVHRDDEYQLTDALLEVGHLVEDRPVTAGHLADALARRVLADRRANRQTLRAAADLLGQHDSLAAGLFAVALLRCGQQLGWPTTWREQVRQFRRYRHPDVRSAALAITFAPE